MTTAIAWCCFSQLNHFPPPCPVSPDLLYLEAVGRQYKREKESKWVLSLIHRPIRQVKQWKWSINGATRPPVGNALNTAHKVAGGNRKWTCSHWVSVWFYLTNLDAVFEWKSWPSEWMEQRPMLQPIGHCDEERPTREKAKKSLFLAIFPGKWGKMSTSSSALTIGTFYIPEPSLGSANKSRPLQKRQQPEKLEKRKTYLWQHPKKRAADHPAGSNGWQRHVRGAGSFFFFLYLGEGQLEVPRRARNHYRFLNLRSHRGGIGCWCLERDLLIADLLSSTFWGPKVWKMPTGRPCHFW